MLDKSFAIASINSTEEFPIDFDTVWEGLEYSTKSNAKKAFLKCGFSLNLDFIIFDEPTTTGIQANPKQNIFLTVDCFKSFCMMANTQKGKGVRMYFIEAEKELNQIKQQQVKPQLTPQENLKERLNIAQGIVGLQGEIPEALRQIMLDNLGDILLSEVNQKQIAAKSDRWIGCSQLAEELGYSLTLSTRVKLGNYIAKQQLTRKRESRLCNGQSRAIWVYLESEALKTCIQDYFSLEALNVSEK